MRWECRGRVIHLTTRPLIMGIVNVTPDSFSDGGRHASTSAAVDFARRLVDEGADLLDIGGESSRPGSHPVSLDEELARVLPVVERLVGMTEVPLSIDTVKAEVARRTLAAGAHIINDISAGSGPFSDPAMLEIVRSMQAGYLIMHMQGTPADMQLAPSYQDVVAEVRGFLEARLQSCEEQGIPRIRIAVDPGIGFGKTDSHNLHLLAHHEVFAGMGRPVCLGVSRKGFLGRLLDRPLEQRVIGSLAAVSAAVHAGTVHLLRVHDVAATRDFVQVIEAVRRHER